MTDRLALIKARHAEAGGGNGDLAWLVAEMERLRDILYSHAPGGHNVTNEQFVTVRNRAERERRHGAWAMRAYRRAPTRWAYERVCEARTKWQQQAEEKGAEVEKLRAKLKEYEDFTAPIREAYEPGSNTAQEHRT